MITEKEIEEHVKYLERTRQYFVHDWELEVHEHYIQFIGTIGRASLNCDIWNEHDMFRKLRG